MESDSEWLDRFCPVFPAGGQLQNSTVQVFAIINTPVATILQPSFFMIRRQGSLALQSLGASLPKEARHDDE
jgi:hypothetical protein